MNNIDKAFDFYRKHIYDREKFALLAEYNLRRAGAISPVMWELFAAIITGRKGNGNVGADLRGWEVKSAINSGSFEYQYHLNTGAQKLKEDSNVNHLFCSYSSDYMSVEVYGMPGAALGKEFFDTWAPEYAKNYDKSVAAETRRQRFRKSIPAGHVSKNGALILKIASAVILTRDDKALEALNK